MIHGSNLMIETPLYLGRKVHHQCNKSDLRSSEMGSGVIEDGSAKFMKMRAGQTQAVMKDVMPRRDQRLAKVMLDMRRVTWQWERRSDKRSGVTLIVISTMSKKTPRKTMDVDRELSFSGEDWMLRLRSRTERVEHEGDSRRGTLAHHG